MTHLIPALCDLRLSPCQASVSTSVHREKEVPEAAANPPYTQEMRVG